MIDDLGGGATGAKTGAGERVIDDREPEPARVSDGRAPLTEEMFAVDAVVKRCAKHGLVLHDAGYCVACAMDTTCKRTPNGCSCQK